MSKKRVIVGMSGGIDSSVAAYLLKQAGYEVIGIFMKNWDDKEDEFCPAAEDFEDALMVSQKLNIPLYAVNFEKEYRDSVFSLFLDEYAKGRTPNPDVLCNKEIKFKAFLEYALKLGAWKIATGHYAQVENKDGTYRLIRGIDTNKDQTYFLHLLNQYQLSKAIFPLGTYLKKDIRAIAQELDLPNAHKKESMGICFIGKRNFRSFLKSYLPSQPGIMQTMEGKKVGMHEGLMFYTIGQRQGLGVGGPGEAWFVVGKNREQNILYMEQGSEHPSLFSHALHSKNFHWIIPLEERTFTCQAKFRHRQEDQAVKVIQGKGLIQVEFQQPAKAITPGQSVVLYNERECLGGGTIDAVFKDNKILDYLI